MRAVGVISLAAMVTTSAAASASAQLRHPDGQPPRWTCSIIVLAVPAIDEAMRHPPPAGGDLSMPIREPDCVPSHVIPAPGSPRRAASPAPSTPPLLSPHFSVPVARLGDGPVHPLTDGLAGAVKPR